jgi:ribosome-interacting GTPase 1
MNPKVSKLLFLDFEVSPSLFSIVKVSKSGDGRVALIGFPSVGKSSLLSTLTDTSSLAAAYEFTTLTCIPGNLM